MEYVPCGIALDIETTGLDPASCEVLAVGLVSKQGRNALTGQPEPHLLIELEKALTQFPPDHLITWNGSEFDLPFLSARYRILEIATTLQTVPTDRRGKYGNPVVNATWGVHKHWDIAEDYRPVAERLSLPWHLKPIARALLEINPIEVNDIANSITSLSEDELTSYVLSDAQITYDLAHLLGTGRVTPNDREVLRFR